MIEKYVPREVAEGAWRRRRHNRFHHHPMSPPNIIPVCATYFAFEIGVVARNRVIRTPNIDRLAARGIRFATAVTNNPVCMPARACMLSGQFSRTCMGELGNVGGDPPVAERVHLKDPTLPEELRAAGYRTGLIGKWHLEPSPRIVGFDHAVYPLAIHRYRGQALFSMEMSSARRWRNSVLNMNCANSTAFFRGTQNQPFFLYYNISLPARADQTGGDARTLIGECMAGTKCRYARTFGRTVAWRTMSGGSRPI